MEADAFGVDPTAVDLEEIGSIADGALGAPLEHHMDCPWILGGSHRIRDGVAHERKDDRCSRSGYGTVHGLGGWIGTDSNRWLEGKGSS